MKKRKIIQSIDEIISFEKDASGKVVKENCLVPGKDFSDLDLSGLDLSNISEEFWNDAVFDNTNFSNTGIRFNPRKLSHVGLYDCEFENVDLSYLANMDQELVLFWGCNLRNTHLELREDNLRLDNNGIKLDKLYSKMPESFWEDKDVDYKFLRDNPFINLSDDVIWRVLYSETYPQKYVFTVKEIKKRLNAFEWILNKFKNSTITKYYNYICDATDELETRYQFFLGNISNLTFDEIIIEENDVFLLNGLSFYNCTFKHIIIKPSLLFITSKLRDSELSLGMFQKSNKVLKVDWEQMDYNSWNQLEVTRIGQVTFKTHLYLELGKQCNCKCNFCRNASFECNNETTDCNKYNLQRIRFNLSKICDKIDTIFIGGGEPTLKVNDLIEIFELRNKIDHYSMNTPNIVIVTNGSLDLDGLNEIQRCMKRNDRIYVSRHAIGKKANNKILNPVSRVNIHDYFEELLYLDNLFHRIVLNPVCTKGGLDTSERILEYISHYLEIGVDQILISSLQEDASLGKSDLNYSNCYVSSDEMFETAIKSLKNFGFEEKKLIYSTGGYILRRLKKNNKIIIFKKYLSQAEEKIQKGKATKYTFDLTMTPSGDIYADWRMENKVGENDLPD